MISSRAWSRCVSRVKGFQRDQKGRARLVADTVVVDIAGEAAGEAVVRMRVLVLMRGVEDRAEDSYIVPGWRICRTCQFAGSGVVAEKIAVAVVVAGTRAVAVVVVAAGRKAVVEIEASAGAAAGVGLVAEFEVERTESWGSELAIE